MKYRNAVLQNNIDITTAGTATYDIDLTDVISRLNFRFNITNHGTTPVIIAHPARAVTKIEVIDGSHVIASLSAEELLAQQYYDQFQEPTTYINGVTATDSYFNAQLFFGRTLWDKDLAFDPKRYMNPQIRLTYNKALYESSSTAMRCYITADLFDELPVSPRGFLMRKEITTWTPATSTTAYNKLPLDAMLRCAFICGYSTTADILSQINTFKLVQDAGKKVPYDHRMSTFIQEEGGVWPLIKERVDHLGASGGEVLYTMASFDTNYTGTSTAAHIVSAPTYVADTLTVIEATGGSRVNGVSHGQVPFHTVILPLGDQANIEDWLDPSGIGTLELQTTAGTVGTSPVGRITVEQLATY